MNPTNWNNAILQGAPRSGAFLQSFEWGEFQNAVGREVRRYDHDGMRAQVVQYPIRGPWYGWTAYRGPIGENLEPRNENLVHTIIKDLKSTRGIFLHIEPKDQLQTTNYKLQTTQSHQPQHTTILDLTKSEDALLATMHEKTRYNIRLADRHGVVVNRLDASDAPLFVMFWELLQKTAARQRFHLHERAYYSAMLRVLRGEVNTPGHASAHIYLATKDGKALATMLAISFASTVTYLHGGSSNEHKELMAPYALHWGVIRNAKSHGATAYDFWGIDEARWPGITRFKLGFGGETVSYPPAVDLPLRPFWYKMYSVARSLRGSRNL